MRCKNRATLLISLIIVALLTTNCGGGGGDGNLDVNTNDEPTYNVYSYSITTCGTVGLPVPINHPYQTVSQIEPMSEQPVYDFIDPLYGNHILYFEGIDNTVVVSGAYEITSYLPYKVTIDVNSIGPYDVESYFYDMYTKAEYWIESDSIEIKTLAETTTSSTTNPYYKARAIYLLVSERIENINVAQPWTDWTPETEQLYRDAYGALATLKRGTGSCLNQALLFVALCRSIGIPARTVHGINNVDYLLGREIGSFDSSHAWAEFFLPNYGWIPADPTGGCFGEIDNSRIIIGIGNNIPLEYETASAWYCVNNIALFVNYAFVCRYDYIIEEID